MNLRLRVHNNENAEVVNESEAALLKRVGVNAGFGESIRKCRIAVQDVDPIVKVVYRTNPAKLAEWLSASHVERAVKRQNPAEPK